MKYIVLILIVIISVIQSCKSNTQHQFIYTFKNTEDISEQNIQNVLEVINKRLNTYGFSSAIKIFEKNKFAIKIYADELNEIQVDKLLINQGRLEFCHTYNGLDFLYYLKVIDITLEKDSTSGISSEKKSILDVFSNAGYGSNMGYIKAKDTTGVLNVLNGNRKHLKTEHKSVRFLFGKSKKNSDIPLYTVRNNSDNTAAITGSSVMFAKFDDSSFEQPVINIEMNESGAIAWEKMTGIAAKEGTDIAIVVNSIVYSAPRVVYGPIKGGKTQISGNFSEQEAKAFTAIFSGKMEIPALKLIKYTKTVD